MRSINLYFYFLFFNYAICDEKNVVKKTLLIPNFRKQVEEVSEEISTDDSDKRIKHDAEPNLVSLMVENIKELFYQTEAPTIIMEAENEVNDNFVTIKDIIDVTQNDDEGDTTKNITSALLLYNTLNLSFSPALDIKAKYSTINMFFKITTETGETIPPELVLNIENRKEKEDVISIKSSDLSSKNKFSSVNELLTNKRSCVSCNNILLHACNDPKNKLIPSKICKKEDDLCYSRHTPFGLVERGCFNTNHNLTVYVCSCNLCNYISLENMPYVFSKKQDWINNVIELSRTKRFRKNIFKEMSCLMCEVNKTSKIADVIYNANCLQGNVGTLPTQECAANEICGVKVIKSKGYVWRGCLSTPLYNHWWTLCDTDLCNYDSIVSMSE